MYFLVSDGAQRDHHHVKAVKPAPVLNVMKAHRSGRAEEQQRQRENFQQAKALEIQRRLLIEFILDQKKNPPRRHRGTEKKPKKLTTKDTKEHKEKINQTHF
jgi:hypothetical protein